MRTRLRSDRRRPCRGRRLLQRPTGAMPAVAFDEPLAIPPLVLDNNLSVRLVPLLADQGHDVEHVGVIGGCS